MVLLVKEELNLLNQKYTSFKQEKSTLSENHKNELVGLQSKLTEVKTLGVNLKKEIDFIKKGICPTCGAPIDQSQLEEKNKTRKPFFYFSLLIVFSFFNNTNKNKNYINK